MQLIGRLLKTEDLKYRYVVRSFMYFPSDMLRYDRAIVVWAEEVDHHYSRPITEYTILGATPPTLGRWASFAYNVVGRVEKIQ